MNDIALKPAATGLRWIAEILTAAADRLEHTFGAPHTLATDERYFDADAYLAEVKNGIRRHTQYY